MNKTLTTYIKGLDMSDLVELFELIIEEMNRRKQDDTQSI